MTPKRILFVIMCVLLILVILLTGVLIGKFSTLLQGFDATPNTTTSPSVSTAPSQTQASAPTPSQDATSGTSATEGSQATTPSTEHQHDYVLTQQVEPKCEAHGSNTYTCACGSVHMEDVVALGHQYNTAGQVIDPTCTEAGYTRFVCSRCDKSTDSNPTEALGHLWDEGTQIPADCVTDACTQYQCANKGCEEILIEDIQEGTALGHSFEPWVPTDDGGYKHVCANCDAVETSADLAVTEIISGSVKDIDGTSYILWEIYVGTENSPDAFRYQIYDYTNANMLNSSYDADQGLQVALDSDDAQTAILPICQDSILTIHADGTYTIE